MASSLFILFSSEGFVPLVLFPSKVSFEKSCDYSEWEIWCARERIKSGNLSSMSCDILQTRMEHGHGRHNYGVLSSEDGLKTSCISA